MFLFPFVGRYKAGGLGGLLWAVLYEVGFITETPFRHVVTCSDFSNSVPGAVIVAATNIIILVGGILICAWIGTSLYGMWVDKGYDSRPDCVKEMKISKVQWRDYMIRQQLLADRYKDNPEIVTKLRKYINEVEKAGFQDNQGSDNKDPNQESASSSNQNTIKALSTDDILNGKREE